MSKKKRDAITITLVIALALIAFSAGYLLNDVIRLQFGRTNLVSSSDDFDIFWEAWSKIEKSYFGDLPTEQQMTYGAVRGAIGVLDDPYTVFVEPVARDFERDSLRGNFGGIGAVLERREDGQIYLMPIPGNPAEAAGIVEGDILLAIDGQEIPEDMSVQDVAELVRGEEGTEVRLTILHPGEADSVEIIVVRSIILLPSVTYHVLEQAPDVGYLRLSRFSGESAGEVAEALAFFDEKSVEKIILDLRQNGGGLLDAAVDVSDHFLDSGPIVYQVSSGEDERVYKATDETVAADVELVILIDGGTASAAEIVAGALHDHKRATLVGMTTFGKGSVQLVYDLSDGSSIHVTSARWFTPDRLQIDQYGLEPDIMVELSTDSQNAGRDEVLQKAIEYLTGLAVN